MGGGESKEVKSPFADGAQEEESSCLTLYDVKCYVLKPVFPGSFMSSSTGAQNIDGYLYYPAFVCPPERIALGREREWEERDACFFTYPKSGTHFANLVALLIAYKGALPEKANIHALSYTAEFLPGEKGNTTLDLYDTSKPHEGPLPRTVISHMPRHHIKLNDVAIFTYVMRDPVATLASMRRMEHMMFGPILKAPLDAFLRYHLYERSTGWLDHVLGWWEVRDRPNVLVLTYEEMVDKPADCVRKLSAHMKVQLTEEEQSEVVRKMSKSWALEHVDPYLHEAKTPFSPPDREGMSKSGFIANANAFKEKFSKEQEAEIRTAYTNKLRAILEAGILSGDAQAAARAATANSFLNANPNYFDQE